MNINKNQFEVLALVEREGGRREALRHGEVSIRPTKTE